MKKLAVLFTTILFVSFLLVMVVGCQPEPEKPIAPPTTRLILEFGELATDDEEAKWENELGRWKPAKAIINGQEKALTSAYFKENTFVSRDDQGRILLVFEWNEEGSQLSEEITSRLINQPLGIFEGDNALLGDDGIPIAPIIRSTITETGQIDGLSFNEADELSQLLNMGQG